MATRITGIALGMIETRGLVPAIEAADAMTAGFNHAQSNTCNTCSHFFLLKNKVLINILKSFNDGFLRIPVIDNSADS